MRHHGLVDALIIDQRTHGLANPGIGKHRLLHAQGHVVKRAALQALGTNIGIFLQGLDIRGRHAFGDIQITALDHQPQGLRLGHVAHDDTLELGRATPITIETGHQNHVIGAPVVEHEGSAASCVGHQPGGAHIIVLFVLQDFFTVQDKGAGRRRQRVEHQHRIGRPRQFNHNGIGVSGADQAVNVVGTETVCLPGRGQGQIEFEYPLQRPHNILAA